VIALADNPDHTTAPMHGHVTEDSARLAKLGQAAPKALTNPRRVVHSWVQCESAPSLAKRGLHHLAKRQVQAGLVN
jgi:hypothetical protein